MSVILQTIQATEALENIKCDGVQIMFDFMRTLAANEKIKYINDLFRMRKMKIQPTETYYHIELIDTDTGEQIEMNVKRNVHQKLIERNIYPLSIKNLFL